MQVSKKQIANILFFTLLISSSLPYIYQAISVIFSGQYVLWTYDGATRTGGGLGSIIPYIKDISCMLLFIVLPYCYPYRRNNIYLHFFSLIAWGTFILIFSSIAKGYSMNGMIQYLISGIRGYIFFVVSMSFCDRYFTVEESEHKLNSAALKIHNLVLLIQFVVSLLFILRSGSITNFGSGGMRIPGAFANSGTLGCYTISAAIFICVQYCAQKSIGKIMTIVQMICVTMLSFASGMRSAQLIVLMFVAIAFSNIMFDVAKIGKKHIFGFTLGMIGFSAPFAVSYILERTNRGSFGDSAVGRLDTVDLLLNQKLLPLLFGNGLGVGTNAAVNFQTADARIFDGTLNTIVGQFGIIGLGILVFSTLFVFNRLIRCSYPNQIIAYGICISVMLIFITGNFFEQFTMVIWIVVSAYLNMHRTEEEVDEWSNNLG